MLPPLKPIAMKERISISDRLACLEPQGVVAPAGFLANSPEWTTLIGQVPFTTKERA